MIITNSLGLSQCWVDAAKHQVESYDRVGWLSVTDLIKPPQMVQLSRRHDAEIVVDVKDMAAQILGAAVHELLEHMSKDHAFSEQRMFIKRAGKMISFKPDRFENFSPNNGGSWHLKDFKITKAFSVMLSKDEWISQANLYIYGLRQNGFNVTETSIEALVKDWTKLDALRDGRYPKSAIIVVKNPIWPTTTIEQYLDHRIQLHSQAESQPDELLPECSMEDRWAKPDRFAVKKKGGVRALPGGADFLTERDAQAFADKKEFPCDIVFRKGASPRCTDYCWCAPFCHQFKTKISQGQMDDEF